MSLGFASTHELTPQRASFITTNFCDAVSLKSEIYCDPVIFHVEHSDDDARGLRLALNQRGLKYLVRHFKDGQTAILAFKNLLSQPVPPFPTLVVLDLQVSGRNGFEILDWIARHEQLSEVPIVILTSYDKLSDIRRATELGATAFFIKDKGFVEVADFIHCLLRREHTVIGIS